MRQRLKFKTQVSRENTINEVGVRSRVNKSKYLDWRRSRANLDQSEKVGDYRIYK